MKHTIISVLLLAFVSGCGVEKKSVVTDNNVTYTITTKGDETAHVDIAIGGIPFGSFVTDTTLIDTDTLISLRKITPDRYTKPMPLRTFLRTFGTQSTSDTAVFVYQESYGPTPSVSNTCKISITSSNDYSIITPMLEEYSGNVMLLEATIQTSEMYATHTDVYVRPLDQIVVQINPFLTPKILK